MNEIKTIKQTTKEILNLLKYSQYNHVLLYDSEKDIFFIYGLNISNVSLLKTHNINLVNNNNIYEYYLLKNNGLKKEINYLLKQKDIKHMIKKDSNSIILNIGLSEPIIFSKKNKILNNPDSKLFDILEYKNFKISLKDLKELCSLKDYLIFDFKNNSFNIGIEKIFKTYENNKQIHIDFKNKYAVSFIKQFIKIIQVMDIKTKYIYFDLSRNSPIKMYLKDFNNITFYIAPKIKTWL